MAGRGLGRTERTIRMRLAQLGVTAQRFRRSFGPSVGSVAVDTRAGGRIGIVHHLGHGVAFLREPGTTAHIWDCPVWDVGRPSVADAERAQSLDAKVTLLRKDS
ncbi:hypothetical protein ACFC1T_02305 [Kitasatospora sp. NPDC056076]|uniref:hypothetical protein n=1 Tax=Kitasatospora sp. NPDC056076 TaxID=3345703 RepID=UPI0035E3813D